MKPFIFFIFIFICGLNYAADLPSNLKVHVDSTPFNIRKNHLKLSHYLAAPCKTESEKVFAFSYWIAKNIKYNLAEMKSNKRNKIAREVLDDRSAVCGGYSALMKQFCDNEGIKCYKISGYAWGGFFNHYLKTEQQLHAWNIIYVENQWRCVDVTWMIDLVRASTFKKTGHMKWIYMDPKEFAATHLPYDPRWQLLDDPNSTEEFWKEKEIQKRIYNSRDSLKALKDRRWYQAELISIKGAFVESQDPTSFINNINLLGMKLVGGFYDSSDCVIGKKIFLESRNHWTKHQPYKDSKKHEEHIKTGLWLADRRIEMGE
ncbi:MAG: hypothetical protein ACI857_000029 [Arenicella sp.]|jgi:hypothetical protein